MKYFCCRIHYVVIFKSSVIINSLIYNAYLSDTVKDVVSEKW